MITPFQSSPQQRFIDTTVKMRRKSSEVAQKPDSLGGRTFDTRSIESISLLL
jgi:hypothetical protein